MSKDDRTPTIHNAGWHGQSVLSQPLCGEVLDDQLDAYDVQLAAMQTLGETTGITSDKLLGRLLDAGFTSQTIAALEVAPIAFVAWASESVSDQECQAAILVVFESGLYDQPDAAARFQSWIDNPPSQELWDLWVDFTRGRLLHMPHSLRKASGQQLLRHATRVANASGGLLGLGAICKAENALLQAIRDLFFLEHSPSIVGGSHSRRVGGPA